VSSVKISTRLVDGVTILDMSGRITLGEGSVQLRDAVRDLLAKGQKHILLNLGDVTYIDSSGIGELVSAFTTAKNQGGELKLLNLTRKVHDLLQITKLYTVFDVKDDEASAIGAFKK
jgi:anti-sigma B factor antagonist